MVGLAIGAAGIGLLIWAAMTLKRHQTTIRPDKGADRLVTDGPFAETREQLGGYFLIEAQTFDEAIAVAKQIPMAASGTVEVRPVIEFP